MKDINSQIVELVKKCRQASNAVAQLDSKAKNQALHAMADQLLKNEADIIKANSIDIEQAKENNLSQAMIDRLTLNHDRLSGMALALLEIATLEDPVGEISSIKTRPNGIQVGMMRIPLGVIAMIYESRPNVTSDAAALCLKAGNAVVLRGGSEAFHSNQAIAAALHIALQQEGIPPEAITLVPTSDRKAVSELLLQDDYIDLIIPRGGEGLIRFVSENSRIPVIKHYKGVCHLYVDKEANLEMAIDLLIDGKTSRPGVCNALETLLVHEDVAQQFLPMVSKAMKKRKVELRGCERTREIITDVLEATDEDYDAEYLALILAIKVVKNMEDTLDHLKRFSSDHTDVIVTNNLENSQRFLHKVNSAVVMVNASSRFSDGGELGLGAEIGISTTKLHAYGPMGVEALTTRKFIVLGQGQTRHPV